MHAVRWLPYAADRAVLLAVEASNPEAVVDAMLELDRMLSADPEGNSESREGPERVAFALPLGVMFEIRAEDRTVLIGDVWRTRPI